VGPKPDQNPVGFLCRRCPATFYTGMGVRGHMRMTGHNEWTSVERAPGETG
jgi:hypothetical protein